MLFLGPFFPFATAVLLVIYHLTLFMMLWSYGMVIFTDPGRLTPEVTEQFYLCTLVGGTIRMMKSPRR